MTVDVLEAAPEQVATPRRFLVLWQNQETRAFHRVGSLEHDESGYRFTYADGADTVDGFDGFAGFPDRQAAYRSASLFPMFANRVMTPRREGYGGYIASLGLADAHPEPFEVLARTLGTRATDLVQLLPVPAIDADGRLSFYFLVHGTRHVDPSGERLASLHRGDRVFLSPEPDNPMNPVAVLVGSTPRPVRQDSLGYVPDALAPLVHSLLSADAPYRAIIERVNQPGRGTLPDHMRLLVRIDAIPPAGFDVDAALTS